MLTSFLTILALTGNANATDWDASGITGPVTTTNQLALFNPDGEPYTQPANGFITTYANLAIVEHLQSTTGAEQVNEITTDFFGTFDGESLFYSLAQDYGDTVANQQITKVIVTDYLGETAGIDQIEGITSDYLDSVSGQSQIQAIASDLFDVELPGRVTTKITELLPASVEDKLDEQFDGRADDDRDSVAFIDDVEAICTDVVNDIVPGMIDTAIESAIVEFEDEAADFVEATAVASMGGALGDAVGDACDARIETLVPGIIESLSGCECEAEIDAAVSAAFDLVPGLIDDAIEDQVPDMIEDAIVASEPAYPAWAFGGDQTFQRYSWSGLGSGGMSTSSLSQSDMYAVPFVEESAGRAYEHISLIVSNPLATGRDVQYALYDEASGTLGDLLWSSASISTTPAEEKLSGFAAGTVTTAGAPFFNGNGDLVLTHGDAIVLVAQTSGITNVRVFNTAGARSIGHNMSGPNITLAPSSGWRLPNTFGSFPATVTATNLVPTGAGNLPAIWLDPS